MIYIYIYCILADAIDIDACHGNQMSSVMSFGLRYDGIKSSWWATCCQLSIWTLGSALERERAKTWT